jgi:hypothetical protein
VQVGGAAQGASTIPRRRRLNALLAIAAVVVIAAVALLAWSVPLATGGVEDANPKAGASSAVIHDDAGNMNRNFYPLPRGKVAGSD